MNEREMTLQEWVARLPSIHLAHREYDQLKAQLEQANEENARLKSEVERFQTIKDIYEAPEHIKYVVRMYGELNSDDRKKIDNIMEALKACKTK